MASGPRAWRVSMRTLAATALLTACTVDPTRTYNGPTRPATVRHARCLITARVGFYHDPARQALLIRAIDAARLGSRCR
jgi:hypothetical protein